MTAAWKDFERRVCRALGAERRPSVGATGWARGSDDDGQAAFAVEAKRTTRYQLRQAWITQARRNAKRDGRPWLLVIAEHNDRRPIAVLDFWELVELAQEAGRVPELEIGESDHVSSELTKVRRAAARAASARRGCDAAVREAHKAGLVLRVIAEAAGVSHEQIRRILNRKLNSTA